MQKAVIVRAALDLGEGRSWSQDVDGAPRTDKAPLRRLLAAGWRVVQTCPMPSELDSCCLVVLESPAPKPEPNALSVADVPLREMHHPRPKLRVMSGESVTAAAEPAIAAPLRIFGLE